MIQPLLLLKRDREEALRPDLARGPDPGRVLACAFCRRAITTTAARIEVAGSHDHTFENPAGFRFHIGCFSEVTGCRTAGAPSSYWTWFPGHTWQIEHCSGCREHLGWLFRSAGSAFHGLVLDRLVESSDDGG